MWSSRHVFCKKRKPKQKTPQKKKKKIDMSDANAV